MIKAKKTKPGDKDNVLIFNLQRDFVGTELIESVINFNLNMTLNMKTCKYTLPIQFHILILTYKIFQPLSNPILL